jgi:iron complex transport system substrate-binding protein
VLALSATSFDAVLGDIDRVARAMQLDAEGDELLAGLRARVRAVHDTLKAAQAPRARVAIIEWTDPVYAGGHWLPEMIRRAGGHDVLAVAGKRSTPATLEWVAAARPEIVLVAPCGFDLVRAATEAERLVQQPEWRSLGLRSVPVWALDGNGVTSRPGPRLVDGIEIMARIFHPTLFSRLERDHAIRIGG